MQRYKFSLKNTTKHNVNFIQHFFYGGARIKLTTPVEGTTSYNLRPSAVGSILIPVEGSLLLGYGLG